MRSGRGDGMKAGTPPTKAGDYAAYWYRERGQRARRIWVTVERVSGDGEWMAVRRPSGWEPQVITLHRGRLTQVQPGDGR